MALINGSAIAKAIGFPAASVALILYNHKPINVNITIANKMTIEYGIIHP